MLPPAPRRGAPFNDGVSSLPQTRYRIATGRSVGTWWVCGFQRPSHSHTRCFPPTMCNYTRDTGIHLGSKERTGPGRGPGSCSALEDAAESNGSSLRVTSGLQPPVPFRRLAGDRSGITAVHNRAALTHRRPLSARQCDPRCAVRSRATAPWSSQRRSPRSRPRAVHG